MYDYVDKATKNLTANQLTKFSDRFRKEAKKEKIAYMWWFLFGAFGGHRFYLGNYGTGLIILTVTVFTLGLGAIAGWIDLVNIPRLTKKANEELTLQIIKDVKRV